MKLILIFSLITFTATASESCPTQNGKEFFAECVLEKDYSPIKYFKVYKDGTYTGGRLTETDDTHFQWGVQYRRNSDNAQLYVGWFHNNGNHKRVSEKVLTVKTGSLAVGENGNWGNLTLKCEAKCLE